MDEIIEAWAIFNGYRRGGVGFWWIRGFFNPNYLRWDSDVIKACNKQMSEL